jgi:hypothetical protein
MLQGALARVRGALSAVIAAFFRGDGGGGGGEGAGGRGGGGGGEGAGGVSRYEGKAAVLYAKALAQRDMCLALARLETGGRLETQPPGRDTPPQPDKPPPATPPQTQTPEPEAAAKKKENADFLRQFVGLRDRELIARAMALSPSLRAHYLLLQVQLLQLCCSSVAVRR